MISTLKELALLAPVIGMSRWLRTDLIIAGTLLFLLFASWATLLAAQTSLHRHRAAIEPNRGAASPQSSESSMLNATERPARRGHFSIFGIVLGLLGSLTLFAICAF
jgi:hypothetical protein